MSTHLGEKSKTRLFDSIDDSQKELDFIRGERIKAIKQFTGRHYATNGPEKRVPVNFLKLAVDIYTRSLAARAPRVMITTINRELQPVAANLELAVNKIPEEIDLTETLRQWVVEALFTMGIVKVGLSTTEEVLGHEYGKPFVDVVTIDDYFLDMSAKDMNDIQFEGNDYWPTYESLKKWAELTKREKEDLKPDYNSPHPGDGRQKRAESIAVSRSLMEYKPRIHTRDVWLPDEGLIVTYVVNSKKIVKETEWSGPKNGPYHKLVYSHVPGNLLPVSNVALWMDLHELGNALFRKLADQADSQKSVLGFTGDDEDAVNAFKKANDGDGIRYGGQQPQRLEAGGIDAKTLAFYLQVKELSSYFAGNVDALGGLAPQSETLGQDKLISQSASALLRDMADKTVDAIEQVFEDLCYYEWNDPVTVRMLEKAVPGYPELKVPVQWDKDARKGRIEDYDLRVDVYSMTDNSPIVKMQKLAILLERYIFPLAPEIRAQGGQIDIQVILDLIAKYNDFNELRDIVFFLEPGQLEGSGQESEIVKGVSSSRQQDGRQRMGPTPSGKSDILQRMLVGDNPQAAESGVL